MAYVPNADDITQPTDPIIAETAQAEFRVIKQRLLYMSGLFQSWNPGDATAEVVFVNGYLGISTSQLSGTNIAATRARFGAFNAKRVWEVTVTAGGSGTIALGVMRQTDTLAAQLGTQDFAYAVLNNGDIWIEGTMTGNVSGAAYTTGDILGFELDTTAGGTFKFLKNGTQQLSTPIDLTGPPSAYYPAVSISPGVSSILANFGTSPFIYSYEGGYSLFSQNIIFPSGIINTLINSRMAIDQEHDGAAVTPATGDYIIDGWKYIATQANKYQFQQDQDAEDAPTGYAHYEGAPVLAAVVVGAADSFTMRQLIEGNALQRFGFGTTDGQQMTLLFIAKASIAGIYSGAIMNNNLDRSYPFSFYLPANTFTPCAISFYPATTGSWQTGATPAALVVFNLGSGADFLAPANIWVSAEKVGVTGSASLVGTNGAKFRVTGVELRPGAWPAGSSSSITPPGFDLTVCRRYYNKQEGLLVGEIGAYPTSYGFPIQMRTIPTVTGGGAGYNIINASNDVIFHEQTAADLQIMNFDARM